MAAAPTQGALTGAAAKAHVLGLLAALILGASGVGVSRDAGVSSNRFDLVVVVVATSEGCGCTSSSGATWLALMGLPTLVLAVRNRRRGAANER